MIVIGILITLAYLAVPAGIIYGIVYAVRRSRAGSSAADAPAAEEPTPGTAIRVASYILSFAGFMAVLFAVAGLIALVAIPVIPGASDLIGAEDARQRASYDAAALVVGLPLWLGLWRYLQRRIARAPAERHVVERRLYLGAIFATAAIVAFFGAQTALGGLLALGHGDNGPHIRDAVTGIAQFVVYAAAWTAYTVYARRERDPRGNDVFHDLAAYAVTGAALLFLLVGINEVLTQAIRDIQGSSGILQISSNPAPWADPISWIAVGIAAWLACQRYDAWRGGDRIVRPIYLYAAMLVLAPFATFNTADLLYEVVRRAFGYSANATTWFFLADTVPLALGAGALWAYHWWLLTREAVHRPQAAGAIPYPRRTGLAVMTAAGAVLTGVGLSEGLWLAIDRILTTHDALSGGEWWRDGASIAIALVAVGLVLWVPTWAILQRAAHRAPAVETDSLERRWLLWGLSVAAAGVLTGFTIVLLYVVFRAVLGSTDANSLSDALRYGAVDLVAIGIGSIFALTLRSEMRERVEAVRPTTVYLTVLLTPGADLSLLQLDGPTVYRTRIAGVAEDLTSSAALDLNALRERIALLGTPEHADRAFLILTPTGGQIFPYTAGAPAVRPEVQSPPSPAAGAPLGLAPH